MQKSGDIDKSKFPGSVWQIFQCWYESSTLCYVWHHIRPTTSSKFIAASTSLEHITNENWIHNVFYLLVKMFPKTAGDITASYIFLLIFFIFGKFEVSKSFEILQQSKGIYNLIGPSLETLRHLRINFHTNNNSCLTIGKFYIYKLNYQKPNFFICNRKRKN